MIDVGVRQHLHQGLGLLGRVGGAGGVAGGVEDKHAGAVRQRVAQLLRRDLEVLVGAGVDDDRNAAAELDLLGVGHPVGRGDDDLVARVQQGGKGQVEAFLAAHAGDDLVGRVGQAVFARQLVADGLLELGHAGGRLGVLGLAAAQRVVSSLLDVVRRVEIGLTGAQADDVHALSAQGGDLVADGDRSRFRQILNTLRDPHGPAFWCKSGGVHCARREPPAGGIKRRRG